MLNRYLRYILGVGAVVVWLTPALAQQAGDPLTRLATLPWWWLAVRGAHTGTPFDLAHTTGTALAVIGAMLLLARVAPALSWLLGAVGAMPLTLYALHVTALAVFPPKAATAAGIALGTLLGVHLAVALVIGVLVRATGLRGPLEAVVGAASRAARRAVTGGAGAGGAGAGRG